MALQTFRSEGDGINEINITPFVDIVLVLLIIFMISTPAMVYRGLTVALPEATRTEDYSHVTLNLALDASGRLYLDGHPMSEEQFARVIQKVREAKMPLDALISADAFTPHGKVVELADHLRSLGISHVGFAVKRRQGK
jgi:biopolymer transport protein ExbD